MRKKAEIGQIVKLEEENKRGGTKKAKENLRYEKRKEEKTKR